MATFNENTTIKVNAAISVSTSSTGVAITYTANSAGYAIVHVGSNSSSDTHTLFVGGILMTAGSILNNNGGIANQLVGPIYLGPNQTISLTKISGPGTAYITGVEFVNTP